MHAERHELVSFSLDGKVAIVTGAAGNIGPAYARALGQAGAAVVVADLNGEGADRVAEELESEGLLALGLQVDIASETSAAAMVEQTKQAFGGIDILVNNAALTSLEATTAMLMDIPIGLCDDTLRVNVTGQLICARACVPSMIERGGGKIINQASAAAFAVLQPYGMSKLALVGLTAGLARELGQHNINVNALAPGFLETEVALKSVPAEWRRQLLDSLALGRHGMPEDLLGALIFLASPASDWITGQCLSVDGGWVMRT